MPAATFLIMTSIPQIIGIRAIEQQRQMNGKRKKTEEEEKLSHRTMFDSFYGHMTMEKLSIVAKAKIQCFKMRFVSFLLLLLSFRTSCSLAAGVQIEN